MKRDVRLFLLVSCLFLISLTGCKDQSASSSSYEPNYLFAYRMGYSESYEEEDGETTDQFLSDSKELLTGWFGTPDEPKLPPLFADSDYEDLISLEKLSPAVGPAAAGETPGERGLYQQFCARCHGETGQGRGSVAASQNPYPRDFRRGLFKYKMTNRNAKPLKSDLAKTIRHGLAGTQMPPLDKCSNTQIDALVEYVVYLSIRGELERKLLAIGIMDMDPKMAFDSDPKKRERLYDVSYRGSTDELKKKAFDDQVEAATDLLTDIADSWIDSEATVKNVVPPKEIPVPGLTEASEIDKDALKASIAKGREIFLDQENGTCSKCHGAQAKGDGQQLPDYDDWTKEWTSQIQIKPDNLDELLPFLARGGMKPQVLSPRNITDGKFRGGKEPKSIHHRILNGIAGTPMPAAGIASSPTEKGLKPDDLWHVVNFVLSLQSDGQPPQP